MKKTLLLLLFIYAVELWAQIFVATNGLDTNTGTIDNPLRTISAAINRIQLGDTIFVRGGVYTLSDANKISISKNGNVSTKYHLFAYNGERPVLDFSSMTISSSNRAISLSGRYWHIKGFDVKGAGDNGMHISGSNNTVEFCAFYENHDTGLQLSNGASNNMIINCDSYFNSDPGQGNADGFAPKLDVGSNNYFYGCRAWQNSDDGWDGYLRPSDDISTVIENCWSFANGYLKNGAASSGNGNGFKMGGSDLRNLKHNVILKNCAAFDNRVKGYDQNNNKGAMTLYNCTGYNNGINYSITAEIGPSKSAILINNASLGNYGFLSAFVMQQKNSWLSPFIVSNDDFLSVDTAGLRGSRKQDGSLPDVNFLHLANGSDLIDAGVQVGIPFYGSAPDLGAFESDSILSLIEHESPLLNGFVLLQNYPNPFNPSTKFVFNIASSGFVSLHIFDILGNQLAKVVDEHLAPGLYEINWVAEDLTGHSLSGGIYFAKLKSGNIIQTIKLILLK